MTRAGEGARRAAGEARFLNRLDASLWAGGLAGPLAWLVDLLASYALVQPACRHGTVWLLHLVTLCALALALGGVWLCWRARASVLDHRGAVAAAVVDRARFMSALGLSLSGFFALLVLAMTVGKIVHGPCDF